MKIPLSKGLEVCLLFGAIIFSSISLFFAPWFEDGTSGVLYYFSSVKLMPSFINLSYGVQANDICYYKALLETSVVPSIWPECKIFFDKFGLVGNELLLLVRNYCNFYSVLSHSTLAIKCLSFIFILLCTILVFLSISKIFRKLEAGYHVSRRFQVVSALFLLLSTVYLILQSAFIAIFIVSGAYIYPRWIFGIGFYFFIVTFCLLVIIGFLLFNESIECRKVEKTICNSIANQREQMQKKAVEEEKKDVELREMGQEIMAKQKDLESKIQLHEDTINKMSGQAVTSTNESKKAKESATNGDVEKNNNVKENKVKVPVDDLP